MRKYILFIYYQPIHVFKLLTRPTSRDKDQARREFILNVILLASICFSGLATISATLAEMNTDYGKGTTNPVILLFAFFLFCYVLSKKGYSKFVSYITISIYLLATFFSSYRWGVDVPQNLLVYALLIIMSGILISSRFAFLITIIISVFIITLFKLSTDHIVIFNVSWREEKPILLDGVVYSATFFIIALLAWLSNREMEKALKRARHSEAALRRERDLLEIKVLKRTEELKQAQLEKMTQMYRFVEFGRVASGIFHDLRTPLNLVSLNLETVLENNKNKVDLVNIHKYIHRAIYGTRRLESFIRAARKQLQNSQEIKVFSISREIYQVIQILTYRLKESHITLKYSHQKYIKTYGNPIKFHQLTTNLINNAIDAFKNVKRNNNLLIHIDLYQKDNTIYFIVKDNGTGIAETYKDKIFDPLFTTKNSTTNIGLGLSITKDIIEKDFHGRIDLDTKNGTRFIIQFPVRTSALS